MEPTIYIQALLSISVHHFSPLKTNFIVHTLIQRVRANQALKAYFTHRDNWFR